MSRARILLTAFWIFVAIGLIWSFRSCDQQITQAAVEHPKQQQFLFYPPSTTTNAASATPVQHNGPYVVQAGYTVLPDTPSVGSFTCQVTLKNTGSAKAVHVQVAVHPYRGTRTDDEDVGRNTQQISILPDNDYRAQIVSHITFPDLAPGESSTQSVTFLNRTDVNPGPNRNPDIIYEGETAQTPPPAQPPAQPMHPSSQGGGD